MMLLSKCPLHPLYSACPLSYLSVLAVYLLLNFKGKLICHYDFWEFRDGVSACKGEKVVGEGCLGQCRMS